MKRLLALMLLLMLTLLAVPAMAEEVVTIPDLSQYVNLPDKYYYDFSQMGVDAEGLWNAVPATSGAYKVGDTLYIPDRGYEIAHIMSPDDYYSRSTELQGSTWVMENYEYSAEETEFFFRTSYGDDIVYAGDTLYVVWANGVDVYCDGRRYVQFDMEPYSLSLEYNDGVMTEYTYRNDDDWACAVYQTDGTLMEVTLGPLSDGLCYRWSSRDVWSCSESEYGTYTSCAAPTEYADVFMPDAMAEMFGTITVEGVPAKPAPILPEAVDIDIPGTPATLPQNLSELNIDFESLMADLPNADGVTWDSGLPVFEDHGYDSVAVTDGWGYDYYPMVKASGYWVVADGTEPNEPFYEGYGVRITIGDVTYEFDEGTLTAVILGDYLRCYPSGTYRIDLANEDGEAGASYDKDGSLVVEEYFPKWLDWQVFFYIKADGSIDYLLTTPNWAKVYYWFPDQGWRVGYWSNNEACDAPEPFVDVTDVAQWCYDARDRLLGNTGGDDSGEGDDEVTAPTAYVNVLPADLTAIEAEAFLNADLTDCDIPSGVTSIGEAAFKGCAELTFVRIPATVTDIAEDAFEGCTKLVIVCEAGSEAETFAEAKGITCITE